jgi:CRISPR-associated protein Csm3
MNITEETKILNFYGSLIISGEIETLTGLHIGGSSTKLEIGGVDKPVVRDPMTKEPYIPGSSLKGKMRTLLSYLHGVADVDTKKEQDQNSNIVKLFGGSADSTEKRTAPNRLIVRDAYPTKETVERWKKMDSELLYTEYKAENSVNRITAEANPRFLERVTRGSCFNFEIVLMLFEKEDTKLIAELFKAMRMLENNYLGGNGTRGYGRVQFKLSKADFVSRDDYKSDSVSPIEDINGLSLKDVDSKIIEFINEKLKN